MSPTTNSPVLDKDSAILKKQWEYTERFLYICDYISKHCSEYLSLVLME
ncbi:hypothetical protein [Anaerocolumna jejuensis]